MVQVVLTNHYAGVERHVGDLAAAIAPLGWRTVAVTSPRADPAAVGHYRSSGAEVVTLRPAGIAAGSMALRSIVRGVDADLVHVHLGNAMVRGALGSAGRPLVATQHFIRLRHQGSLAAPLLRPVYARLLDRMDAIIAISGAVESALRAMLAASSAGVHTIPHGIPDVEPAPEGKRPPVLLFVGRLEPEKEPLIAVQAAARAGSGFQLWVAGAGSLESEVRTMGDALLGPRFRFIGFSEDVAGLYAQARALVLPSTSDAFGLVAIEAMRSRLPVVASRSGALPELVDATVGRLFEPGDVEDLAAALAEVMAGDGSTASRLGARARSRYLSRFQAGPMAERTADVYAGLLRG